MNRLLLGVALVAILAPAATPVSAASRTYCLCQGKESGRLHHRFACEYHFKKPGKWPAVGKPPQSGGCTKQEAAQFRTHLCVTDGCTYEYVRASSSKVPLSQLID